jgi:Ribonuclease G/E
VKRRAVIENAIGETRAAVYEGKRLTELYTRRWSEKNKPRAGDIFAGRVTRIEPSLGAAFVDLGHGPDGFLKFANAPGAPRLTEGRFIEAFITREAEARKGPILKFGALSEGQKPGPIKTQSLRDFIATRFKGIKIDEAAVNALDEAVQSEIAITGGGSIAIEKTRALTAIDIDKGTANSGFDVSLAACVLIARQVRLRGLGGLIVIDFPNLRQNRQREKVCEALEAAFEADPEPVKFAPISRFGALEMTRAKMRLSLDETLMDTRHIAPTVETQAIAALRRLEREGRAGPGARLILIAPQPVYDWLMNDVIDWKAAMIERLGARFELKLGAAVDVEHDR